MRGWLAAIVSVGAVVAGCDPEPFTMVVTVNNTALTAYRDGDGAWKPVEPGLTGRARIRIETGRYSLVWACGSGITQWNVIHSTVGDEPQADCNRISNPIRVGVLGFSTPFADIYIGSSGSKAAANGSPLTSADELGNYSASVPAGYYDVVAVARHPRSVPVRALIQHDTDLRSSRIIDLPVDVYGADLTTVETTITGSDQNQDVVLMSELHTHNGTVIRFPGDGYLVTAFSASQLVDGDYQIARVDGTRVDGGTCTSSARIDGPTLAIQVPAPALVLVERRRFRWTSDLDWRYVQLTLDNSTTITATRDWMEAQGTDDVEIPDFSTLPGFSVDLTIPSPGQPVDWTFTSERGHPSSTFASCLTRGRVESW
ncbi:MAG: hypothetical protein SFX73_09750 [Kofleriaceae bacterium]|nr:hypothetical protein [Kofleriaceae bacterium]